MSIVHACERNRLYLLGRKFQVYNDHKALINLLNNPNATIPLRIERMSLRLQGYDFEMKHVKGEENISDYSSRHPVSPSQTSDESTIEKYVNMITRFAVPKAFKIEDIERETRKEHLLNVLKSLIINNNWYILNEPQKHEQLNQVI